MLTWLEIDSGAIRHNLREFRKLVGKQTLLMPVIKSNAYGHGFLEIAEICQNNKDVDRLCVVNLDEALALIKHRQTKKPIMILSFYEQDEKKLMSAIKHGVIFPLYTLEQAKFLESAGERAKKKVIVHLKIDAGTTRVGILPDELKTFLRQLKKYRHLKIEGVFSHLASSEDNKKYTLRQIDNFREAAYLLRALGISAPIKHLACSAAAILYKNSRQNAVRLGLSFYGEHASGETKKKLFLKPALSWYTRIIQVKQIPAGTRIGYGGTFITTKPTTLAILPIGYADGYDRRLGNRGRVLIRDIECPVVGRVCMNLTMVDATKVKNIKAGDRVTVLGRDKDKTITLARLAKLSRGFNYELITKINSNLPRIVK